MTTLHLHQAEKSDREESGSEKDGKKQCLALIDRGSDDRGVEMERERGEWDMSRIKRVE